MIARHRLEGGFTLIEIAIAMLILMLLAGAGVAALRLQMRHSELDTTKTTLETTRLALVGFASVNGRLPCPDIDSDGVENITLPDASTRACSSQRGNVPYADLGITRPSDGWYQDIHYLVNSDLAKQVLKGAVWTPVMNTATPTSSIVINAPSTDCTSSSTSQVTATAIAFALWSSGENRTDASKDETGNRVLTASPTCPIDDILNWTSRYVLIGSMLSAGWIPQQ